MEPYPLAIHVDSTWCILDYKKAVTKCMLSHVSNFEPRRSEVGNKKGTFLKFANSINKNGTLNNSMPKKGYKIVDVCCHGNGDMSIFKSATFLLTQII